MMTDGELAAAFASTGSRDAFDELVRRHVLMVFRTCRRVTRDHHEAEEATQAVFIALASHAPRLKSYRSVAGWLYSTAWNVARRKRTARDTRRLHEQRLIPATTSDMHVPLPDEELSELYRALRMLPPDYLHAIVLHHLEGMTIAEVAEVMGCTVGTTAARISRGRAMMRERLARRGIVMPLATFAAAIGMETAVQDFVPTTLLVQLPAAPALGAAHLAVAAGPSGAAAGSTTVAGWTTKWAAAACIAVSIGTGSVVASRSAPPTLAHTPLAPSPQKTIVAASSIEQTKTFAGKLNDIDSTFTGMLNDIDWSSRRSGSVAVPEPSMLSLLGLAMLAARRPRRRAVATVEPHAAGGTAA